jgi:hypothetical protein
MIRSDILVLDEGNRMPERTWALLDDRRYMDSASRQERFGAVVSDFDLFERDSDVIHPDASSQWT